MYDVHILINGTVYATKLVRSLPLVQIYLTDNYWKIALFSEKIAFIGDCNSHAVLL